MNYSSKTLKLVPFFCLMNRGSILSLPTDRGIEQYNKSCNWIELPKYFQPYNQEHALSRDEYVLVNLSSLA